MSESLALDDRAFDAGVAFRTGPFTVQVRTDVAGVKSGMAMLYGDYPAARDAAFIDFRVAVRRRAGPRRWLRPQIEFAFDGHVPFKPLPLDQALPALEWGLNWVVSTNAHQYLIVHAAAIERNGRVAILPGPPGSGKSTLCAGLVHRGWRLLSDELTLIDRATGLVVPLARPINLKNESIDVIRGFVPGAALSKPARDTVKGTVALLKAPSESVARSLEPARPAWIVVPKFAAGSATEMRPKSRAETFIELGQNAFNYSIHGADGFRLLARVMDWCRCFHFRYSDLDAAVAAFAALTPREAP